MVRALQEYVIGGPPTLIEFHLALLEHPCFAVGSTCLGVVDSEQLAQRADESRNRGRVGKRMWRTVGREGRGWNEVAARRDRGRRARVRRQPRHRRARLGAARTEAPRARSRPARRRRHDDREPDAGDGAPRSGRGGGHRCRRPGRLRRRGDEDGEPDRRAPQRGRQRPGGRSGAVDPERPARVSRAGRVSGVDVGALIHDLVSRETLTGATLSKPRRSDPARPTGSLSTRS